MKNVALVCAAALLVACGGGLGSSMRFVNDSQEQIQGLYFSAIDEATWGRNYLGGEPLQPGDTFTLTDIECGRFDVRLVNVDGDECIIHDEPICVERSDWVMTQADLARCAGQTQPAQVQTAGGANDSAIALTNASRSIVAQLYLSPVGEGTWGPDQLGGQPMSPGDTHTITNVPCGHYDARLVDPDGAECLIDDVDICAESSSWVMTEHELADCHEMS